MYLDLGLGDVSGLQQVSIDVGEKVLSASIAYQIAHLDDASGRTALGSPRGALLAIFGDRTVGVGVLLNATSGSDDLGGGLAATARRATGARGARLTVILQDLVEGLTKLGRHGSVVVGREKWAIRLGVGGNATRRCDATAADPSCWSTRRSQKIGQSPMTLM